MINDHLEILQFLLDKIVDSGLSERMEYCGICVLGDADELTKVKELIGKYPKVHLRDWSVDKGNWEGHTLKNLWADAHYLPKFYALYAHTKSVTYPKGGDGKTKTQGHKDSEIFWRDYMTWGVIERWRDCYKALDMPDKGYDICGVRAISRRYSASIVTHFSGNFVFVNSEYVKDLIQIRDDDAMPDGGMRLIELYKEMEELKKTHCIKVHGNIFWPEMIWGTGQPLTYIASNAHTVGFPADKTFEQTLKEGYPIKDYSTDISHTL